MGVAGTAARALAALVGAARVGAARVTAAWVTATRVTATRVTATRVTATRVTATWVTATWVTVTWVIALAVGAAPGLDGTAGAAPAVVPAAWTVSARTVPGTPCSAAVRACIDLAHNRAWLVRGGIVEFGPVPITSGRAGFPTPAGTFRVLSRQRLHLSREFDDAPMPYSVFFVPGIAFHQGSLAVPSHGCIHLARATAARFYAELAVGDVVQAVR